MVETLKTCGLLMGVCCQVPVRLLLQASALAGGEMRIQSQYGREMAFFSAATYYMAKASLFCKKATEPLPVDKQ